MSVVGVYLVKRPALDSNWRWLLLLGLGVLPVITSTTGAVEGLEATQRRSFCGSCHVMEPWTGDAADPNSNSLAAIHSRIPMIGDQSCYVCHADYGMFGTAVTKMNGMLHVWHYVTQYSSAEIDDFVEGVHLYSPYQNRNCMHCHSTTGPRWQSRPDHRALADKLKAGTVSCASTGCHGSPHPFKKREQEQLP